MHWLGLSAFAFLLVGGTVVNLSLVPDVAMKQEGLASATKASISQGLL